MNTGNGNEWQMTAAALAREFDLGFSRATDVERAPEVNLLVVQLGAQPFAVRASEIRAIVTTPRIAYVPSRAPALLGIGGIRGEILPVFDLARLLGIATEERALRWSILAGEVERAALAFHHFERFERVPATALSRSDQGGATAAFVEEVVRLERGVLSIIGIARLLAGLRSVTAQ